MRNVLVSFEVSVSQSNDPLITVRKSDYVFTCEGDKDNESFFSVMCETEYKVQSFCRALKDLGCQVICIRKEVSHLEL